MPSYTRGDAIKFTGGPTKTIGEPSCVIGDAIKYTGMPTKSRGEPIYIIGDAIKFYYFLMRPDSIKKTAFCVFE